MRVFARRLFAIAGLLWVSTPFAARAQSLERDSAQSAVSARWTFGAWISGGTGQPLETRLGHVHDRSLFFSALRAIHPLVVTPRFRLQSTIDVFPLVVATANREYEYIPRIDCTPDLYCINEGDSLVATRRTAYAAGIAPLGFEGVVTLSDRIGVSAGVEGGALYFDRRIPDPGETRFNFVADANVALRVSLGAARPTLVGGFRLNHISNGGTGRVNPGMDSKLLFIGIE